MKSILGMMVMKGLATPLLCHIIVEEVNINIKTILGLMVMKGLATPLLCHIIVEEVNIYIKYPWINGYERISYAFALSYYC